MHVHHTLFIAAAGVALICSGCGGGGTPPNLPLNPTPSPTATPTPNPLAANPVSLSFSATGATAAQTIAVSETSYSGAFDEGDTCAGIASVTPSSASGPKANFTVTPSAAGSCTVTIKDANGQHSATSVNVTTTSFGVDRRTVR
jgi:hypothetical protein